MAELGNCPRCKRDVAGLLCRHCGWVAVTLESVRGHCLAYDAGAKQWLDDAQVEVKVVPDPDRRLAPCGVAFVWPGGADVVSVDDSGTATWVVSEEVRTALLQEKESGTKLWAVPVPAGCGVPPASARSVLRKAALEVPVCEYTDRELTFDSTPFRIGKDRCVAVRLKPKENEPQGGQGERPLPPLVASQVVLVHDGQELLRSEGPARLDGWVRLFCDDEQSKQVGGLLQEKGLEVEVVVVASVGEKDLEARGVLGAAVVGARSSLSWRSVVMGQVARGRALEPRATHKGLLRPDTTRPGGHAWFYELALEHDFPAPVELKVELLAGSSVLEDVDGRDQVTPGEPERYEVRCPGAARVTVRASVAGPFAGHFDGPTEVTFELSEGHAPVAGVDYGTESVYVIGRRDLGVEGNQEVELLAGSSVLEDVDGELVLAAEGVSRAENAVRHVKKLQADEQERQTPQELPSKRRRAWPAEIFEEAAKQVASHVHLVRPGQVYVCYPDHYDAEKQARYREGWCYAFSTHGVTLVSEAEAAAAGAVAALRSRRGRELMEGCALMHVYDVGGGSSELTPGLVDGDPGTARVRLLAPFGVAGAGLRVTLDFARTLGLDTVTEGWLGLEPHQRVLVQDAEDLKVLCSRVEWWAGLGRLDRLPKADKDQAFALRRELATPAQLWAGWPPVVLPHKASSSKKRPKPVRDQEAEVRPEPLPWIAYFSPDPVLQLAFLSRELTRASDDEYVSYLRRVLGSVLLHAFRRPEREWLQLLGLTPDELAQVERLQQEVLRAVAAAGPEGLDLTPEQWATAKQLDLCGKGRVAASQRDALQAALNTISAKPAGSLPTANDLDSVLMEAVPRYADDTLALEPLVRELFSVAAQVKQNKVGEPKTLWMWLTGQGGQFLSLADRVVELVMELGESSGLHKVAVVVDPGPATVARGALFKDRHELHCPSSRTVTRVDADRPSLNLVSFFLQPGNEPVYTLNEQGTYEQQEVNPRCGLYDRIRSRADFVLFGYRGICALRDNPNTGEKERGCHPALRQRRSEYFLRDVAKLDYGADDVQAIKVHTGENGAPEFKVEK